MSADKVSLDPEWIETAARIGYDDARRRDPDYVGRWADIPESSRARVRVTVCEQLEAVVPLVAAELRTELERTEGDLAVALREATDARADVLILREQFQSDVTPDPACDCKPRDPVDEWIGRFMSGNALGRQAMAKAAIFAEQFAATVERALRFPHADDYPTGDHE